MHIHFDASFGNILGFGILLKASFGVMDKTKEKRCSTSWPAHVSVAKRFDLIKIRCLEIISTYGQNADSKIHIRNLHLPFEKKDEYLMAMNLMLIKYRACMFPKWDYCTLFLCSACSRISYRLFDVCFFFNCTIQLRNLTETSSKQLKVNQSLHPVYVLRSRAKSIPLIIL